MARNSGAGPKGSSVTVTVDMTTPTTRALWGRRTGVALPRKSMKEDIFSGLPDGQFVRNTF